MNPALLAALLVDAIKYGPAIIQLIKEGIVIEEAAHKAAPDFIPHLENVLRDIFAPLDPKPVLHAVLAGMHQSVKNDPAPAHRIPSEMEGVR